MRKIDWLVFVGVFVAIAALVVGQWLEGGALGILLNGAAAVIVFGGSIGAVLVQTPSRTFKRALQMLSRIVADNQMPFRQSIGKLVNWSMIARRDGLLGLEDLAESEPDPFVRHGLILLVDGAEPETIRTAMTNELILDEQQGLEAARVYEAMGGYSPTMGIIGAVLGLIHVMGNLTDPGKLGPGIATAFVATVYGVGFANLVLLPIAHKLKYRIAALSRYREMMIDGIVAIAEGENPRVIEYRLSAFARSDEGGAL